MPCILKFTLVLCKGDPALLHRAIVDHCVKMSAIDEWDLESLKNLASTCKLGLPSGSSKVIKVSPLSKVTFFR